MTSTTQDETLIARLLSWKHDDTKPGYRRAEAEMIEQMREAADTIASLRAEVERVTADRDEWKQQHENLLAVRQTDITNLTAARDEYRRQVVRVGDAPCPRCGYSRAPEKP